jgi:hypothetical protein
MTVPMKAVLMRADVFETSLAAVSKDNSGLCRVVKG